MKFTTYLDIAIGLIKYYLKFINLSYTYKISQKFINSKSNDFKNKR